jgi:type VI secretion system protein ImpH
MKHEAFHRHLTVRRQFFELLRRVDLLARARRKPAEQRSPEWLRIEQSAAAHFAGTEVSEVRIDPPYDERLDDTPVITVIERHFGLFAPYGPMPLAMTDHAMAETRFERNPAFARFINIACGDLAWLHYAAWARMHPVLGYERARHPFVERVTAFAHASEAEDPDAHACRHAFPGLYCAPRRSLHDLQRMLTRYFHASIRIVPRHQRWMPLDPVRHGARQIGTWRLGKRVWDAQYSIGVEVGPIEADAFAHWHRRAPALNALCAVIADFIDGTLSPRVRVQVRTRPEMAGAIGRMRLGISTWMRPDNALHTVIVHESFQG